MSLSTGRNRSSQYGYDLTARVYRTDATGAAKGHYQVTVVDYNGIHG
jgi:hypothetical protein